MSLDSVFVDLSAGAFDSGQAYVAISRVRTINGLHLREKTGFRCLLSQGNNRQVYYLL
ncbi:MAG: hypothetical protein HC888_04720 [Candidatus Competibacteraceae bacterium]|nr:hypothetical protein [Candidatus Competibacteraceae bacterium]